MRLVVDASVAAKWVLKEPDSDAARRIADRAELLAPDLLWAELGNVLWRRQRLGELSPTDARDMLFTLRAVPVRTHALFPLLPLALEIAVTIGHSIYDCIYLALGRSGGLPRGDGGPALAECCRLGSHGPIGPGLDRAF